MNIKKMISFMNESMEYQPFLKNSVPFLLKFYSKHKTKIPIDEIEDFIHDLLMVCFETMQKWNSDKGIKFTTMLYGDLLNYEKTIITKYTGIKVTKYTVSKLKKQGEKLNLQKIPIERSEI